MNRIARREFVKSSVAAAGLGCVASRSGAEPVTGPRPPNLLYVFPDQFRVFALGFMKADPVITPNLDRFAAESVFFPNAVSNSPVCSPYRGMLLTGRWPHSTGLHTNCNSSKPDVHLKPTERCVSDVLSDAGYTCGYIGKLHLDTPTKEDAKYGEGPRGGKNGTVWDAYTPPGPRRHGFTFWHSYGCCDRHLRPHYWHNDAPVSQPTEVEEWSVKHETDVAVDFILNKDGKQRDRDKPFALFISFNPPHPPYSQVPEKYRELYKDRTADELLNRPNVERKGKGASAPRAVADYFAAVTGVDEQFGRLMEALTKAGASDNTVVVFTADHGEMMGSQGLLGKTVIYEESFQIPFILRHPQTLEPGTNRLHLNVPDVMPTLLGLMGLSGKIPAQVEGVNRSRLIRTGEGEKPTSSFYLMGPTSPTSGARGVRTDRHTFLVSQGGAQGAKVLLFDRATDPYQQNDISADKPEICKELLEELNRWLGKTRDPWPPLKWPIRPAGAFAIRATKSGHCIDFEPSDGPGPVGAPVMDLAMVTDNPAEVIGGTRSVKADTNSSSATYHEFLRFHDLFQPNAKYEIRYRYRVLAANADTNFYTVVRSTRDINTKAARIYWHEEPAEAKTRQFVVETGDVKDHHLLFGIRNRGAIVVDDITVTRLDRDGE